MLASFEPRLSQVARSQAWIAARKVEDAGKSADGELPDFLAPMGVDVVMVVGGVSATPHNVVRIEGEDNK